MNDNNLFSLENIGIKNAKIQYQLTPDELHQITLDRGEGIETSTGALAINTGNFQVVRLRIVL